MASREHSAIVLRAAPRRAALRRAAPRCQRQGSAPPGSAASRRARCDP
jgi:hypothetical protein